MSLYRGMSTDRPSQDWICDLRSDTLTQPDAAMRDAMAKAVLGDDVYGEDPTVAALETRLAKMLDKEAGVFFPTGTQSNLAAVMTHCGRGDEIIIGNTYHIYCDEAAGASVLAGVALCPVETEANGALGADAVQRAIKEDDPHYARSRLLCLENTVGGQAISLADIQAGSAVARSAGLAIHLDGARYFNATLALECDLPALARCADTVSVCMSKGLGAPAGAVLLGSQVLMAQARRHRKILGGAMRQSGVLAAAALHALDYHLPDLARDHSNATQLAQALRDLQAGHIRQGTNMLFLTPRDGQPDRLRAHMAKAGIRLGGQSPAIRIVLHRDVTDQGLEATIKAFQTYFQT